LGCHSEDFQCSAMTFNHYKYETRILHLVPPKSSSVDFVPPSLVKSCAAVFAELIAELANRSFRDGCSPSCFKHAAITPILKKPTLNTSDPPSYRPISYLDFISKIIERLFLARFQPHALACSNFNNHQSAYRPRHSTETSLLASLNTIYRASDSGSSTLDLSAAFTSGHSAILVQPLGLLMIWLSQLPLSLFAPAMQPNCWLPVAQSRCLTTSKFLASFPR